MVFLFVFMALSSSALNFWVNTRKVWNEVNMTHYSLSTEMQNFSDPTLQYVGSCRDELIRSTLEIYTSASLPLGIDGVYYNDAFGVVFATSTSIGLTVVAHEVSHFVDNIMVKKGIHDGETRAYIQGYFTNCIYEKLKIQDYYESYKFNVIHF